MYYVTFGQKYEYERHPKDDRLHPDYLVKVNIEDYMEARKATFEVLGKYWSNITDTPGFHFYSGIIAEIDKTDNGYELIFRGDSE